MLIPRSSITRRRFLIQGSAAASGLILAAGSGCVSDVRLAEPRTDGLSTGFANPPPRARPGAYWVWPDGNFDLDQITRELEDLKEKGLSGLEIFDIAARDDDNVVPDGPAFMSREAREGYAHAIREATRLGLEMGFITSSSWNAGGPWVTPETASKALYASETRVSGPAGSPLVLPYPEVPEPAFQGHEGGLQPWSDEMVYSEDIAVLALPARDDRVISEISDVVDLTGRLQEGGRLDWDAPSGEWVVLRIVCTNNRERLRLPSPHSDGYMIDHLSAEATEMHFRHIVDGLLETLGTFEGTALKYLYLPSYEVRGLTEWTPAFGEEFARRRGYSIRPFLPVLFGWTITNANVSERFDHDRRLTVSDLLIENHYAKAAEVCHQFGLELHAEAGGPGPPLHDFPAEALRALSVLDVPRGEFWVRNAPDEDDRANVIKAVASTAHIYGGQIAEMESFTGWNHWERVPFDLKPYADRVMCEGVNRFVFHTYPHNPPEAGKPGWAYFAGTHVGMNRAWWPMAAPFISYLARSSYLLQEGLFVADVCFYYGHDAPLLVPNKRFDENTLSLGPGYDYDYVNTDVLLNRMEVQRGRIVLPDGMSYAVLALPRRRDMPLEVLQKIEQLVRDGATVVGQRPEVTPGLYASDEESYRERDAELQRLADQLWAEMDDAAAARSYGQGRVVQGMPLREVLEDLGISPDFTFTSLDPETDLDYIHRRIGEEDVYFVANARNRWETVDAVFRVAGKQPELWFPDTGERRPLLLFDSTAGGTRVRLHLPPYGSAIVVFRSGTPQNHVVSLDRNGERLYPVQQRATGRPPIETRTGQDVPASVVVWARGTYRLHTSEGQLLQVEGPEPEFSMELSGPWDVHFPAGWGAPEHVVLPELISWTDHQDEGVRYFSGAAEYQRTFELPAEWLSLGNVLELDLGELRGVAEVDLNDQPLGILWKPPYVADVTNIARPGENALRVSVANVWANRLLGDRGKQDSLRFTGTNIPQDVQRDEPTPSGLLGPVRVRVGVERALRR